MTTGGSLRRALGGLERRLRRRSTSSATEVGATEVRLGACVICRGRDTRAEMAKIAQTAVRVITAAGAKAWRLPDGGGIRIGVDSSRYAQVVAALRADVDPAGVVVKEKTAAARNNKYEFDQVMTMPPDSALFVQLYPRPHCAVGAGFLRRRRVTIESMPVTADFAIVPRGGLGPRVYGIDRLPKLSISSTDAFQPVPEWPHPVDLVYTWVDSSDPAWRREFDKHAGTISEHPKSAANAARWLARDELRFSLRSAWMYAPFFRNIYVVTNGQVPPWLREDQGVTVVRHDELFDDPDCLPTFSSRPIESVVHKIPGLSDHFVYLNDDFFFGSPVEEQDFFSIGGICKVFFSNRYLDARPVSNHDRASVVAHKNTREAIAARTGIEPTQKFKHAPYVMRRDAWDAIEKDFEDELRATRRNRFRSWTDINPVPYLYNHYALIHGYAVPGEITYKYVDIGAPELSSVLAEVDGRGVKVFCVNDADSEHDTPAENEETFGEYLASRYPVVPPWEVEGS